jgi:hypothetical protein
MESRDARSWMGGIWDDPVARIVVVVLLVSRIPIWFMSSGSDGMWVAIDAVLIAAALVIFAWRGHVGELDALLLAGIGIAVGGLLLEAGWWAVTSDDPPLLVTLLFWIGIALMVMAYLVTARRASRP